MQGYISGGMVHEWVDGCVTIPVRQMSLMERAAWDNALLLARTHDADDAMDTLARWANNAETASLRLEMRGLAADAVDAWRRSELYDRAAAALL